MWRMKRRRPALKPEYVGDFTVNLAPGLNPGSICAFCISGKNSLDVSEPRSLAELVLNGTVASAAFSAPSSARAAAPVGTKAVMENGLPISSGYA